MAATSLSVGLRVLRSPVVAARFASTSADTVPSDRTKPITYNKAPYILHASIHQNNAIFTLAVAPKTHPAWGSTYRATDHQQAEVESATARMQNYYGGKTMLRISSGAVKDEKGRNLFKHSGRGTYEAQTAASLKLMERYEELLRCAHDKTPLKRPEPRPGKLGEKDRKAIAERERAKGVPDFPPAPSEVWLVLDGFGQAREALTSTIISAQGEKLRSSISKVVDATTLKRGGSRPRKPRRV